MKLPVDQHASHLVAPVTAIITAFSRIEQTLDTIRRIEACQPPPDEVLVHVDGNETACADAIRSSFPHLNVILSGRSVGPGGSRNKLVEAARNELIASFDDDSYPVDSDFFNRVEVVARAFPAAAILGANIIHIGEEMPDDKAVVQPTSSFGSGGVIFRRKSFLQAGGFVPLEVAYGMEEEDLALRLIDDGQQLIHCPWLRVFHNTDRSHHASARITAGTISNLALLAWLRFPVNYWPYAVLQVANRVLWCLRVGRHRGIASGVLHIPVLVIQYWQSRQPVSVEAMKQRAILRRNSRSFDFPNSERPH